MRWQRVDFAKTAVTNVKTVNINQTICKRSETKIENFMNGREMYPIFLLRVQNAIAVTRSFERHMKNYRERGKCVNKP